VTYRERQRLADIQAAKTKNKIHPRNR